MGRRRSWEEGDVALRIALGGRLVAPRGLPRGAQDGDDGETDEERADAALRDGVGAERDGDRRPGDGQRDPRARTVAADLVDVVLAGLFGPRGADAGGVDVGHVGDA